MDRPGVTPDDFSSPTVAIVGGVHGAGKSTFCRKFLTIRSWPYLTQQEILRQYPAEMTKHQVAKQLLAIARNCLATKTSFLFEHVMSGHFVGKLITLAHSRRFHVHLVYINLTSVDISLQRIEQRIKKGGHDIEHTKIAERLDQSRRQFWRQYAPLADSWELYDNSGTTHCLLARLADKAVAVEVTDKIRLESYIRSL